MGYDNFKYILNSTKYAKAITTDSSLQLNLVSNSRLLQQDNVIKLVNIAELYDQERQKSQIFRLYGRFDHIFGNALEEYSKSKLELVSTTGNSHNYNLQVLYPESSTNYCPLFNFSSQNFGYSCSSLYNNPSDCEKHTIYHGLPFNGTQVIDYNGREQINLSTYRHKNGNNIKIGEYVYITPGEGGTSNPIYGFNQILLNRSIDGDKTSLIIKKKGELTSSYGGAYRRVVNVSQRDINFDDSLMCQPYYTGGTNDGIFIRVNGLHNVEVGDYIDLRVTGSTEFNQFHGLHRVNQIVNDFIFKCNVPYYLVDGSTLTNTYGQELNNSVYNYRYRKIDGVPSEYHLRKFKVLVEGDRTTNILDVDYSLKNLPLSRTVWRTIHANELCNIPKQSGYEDDKIVSYVINRDINIGGLTDYLNRPLTELYLGIIKRKDPEFDGLYPNFENSVIFSGIGSYDQMIELPTQTNPNVLTDYNYFNLNEFSDAGLPVGNSYYGDIIEYNPLLLREYIIDPITFRIGRTVSNIALEGYVYSPFKQIPLRYFSEDIETVTKYTLTIPDYYETVNGTKQWRDINPYGFKDITQFGVKSINSPFTNNTHYYFNVGTILLRRQGKDQEDDVINIIVDGNC